MFASHSPDVIHMIKCLPASIYMCSVFMYKDIQFTWHVHVHTVSALAVTSKQSLQRCRRQKVWTTSAWISPRCSYDNRQYIQFSKPGYILWSDQTDLWTVVLATLW